MRRLPFAFFLLLTGTSLAGLGLAWLINTTLFGRPHGALLQMLAETAAEGIDCTNPSASPIFHPASHSSRLNLVLLNAEGQALGKTGFIPAEAPVQRDLGQHSFPWPDDNPLRADQLWVRVDAVCHQPWTLWAYDPNNHIYRHMMLPRQIVLFLVSCSSIIFVVLLAYLFLRRKGQIAQSVLQKIRKGEWGSHIPQSFWEPRLRLIDEFNSMAASVAESFQKLQTAEERRTRLLSELSHDVRTPLASLRAAAETLREFHRTMSEAQREKLQETLMLDLLYFQGLIDDLMILAQLDRIDSLPPVQRTDLRQLLPRVWQSAEDSWPSVNARWQWPSPCPEKLEVYGDEQLLRRILQNTFANAFRYAKSYVHATIHLLDDRLRLEVANDAAILSDEDISNWGHKRRQRIITEKAGQAYTSLGLGSSIIVGGSRYLGGEAWIKQTKNENEEHSHVSVFIDIPWLP